jgi:uncharacterized LabA/DUF88 family protein
VDGVRKQQSEGKTSMSTYVYVDGESHFIRSRECWKKMCGEEAELRDIKHFITSSAASQCYPDPHHPLIRLLQGKFFWDKHYPCLLRAPFSLRRIDRAIYFTDFAGDNNDYHEVCVAIRQQGFEPQVIRERVQLAKQRENRLKIGSVLEKPKGVDIGLTVRLLEEAYRGIYDQCFLFTSDIDYLPVIQAIQRLGRKVIIFGYKDGLGINSELEYISDSFIDLEEYMRQYTFGKEDA